MRRPDRGDGGHRDPQGQARLLQRSGHLHGLRPAAAPAAGRRPRGGVERGRRRGGAHPLGGRQPAHLRAQLVGERGAAQGRRTRRQDRRRHRLHVVRLSRPHGARHAGGRRAHLHAGRGARPRRPRRLLGLQPGRLAPAPLPSLLADREGGAHAQRAQRPHDVRGRRAAHGQLQEGRPLPADRGRQRLRGAHHPAPARARRRAVVRRGRRRAGGGAQGAGRAHEVVPLRRRLHGHGPHHGAGAPAQRRGAVHPRGRAQRPRQVLGHPHARARQRHRRRPGAHVDHGLPVRRQFRARLSRSSCPGSSPPSTCWRAARPTPR